MRFADKKVFL